MSHTTAWPTGKYEWLNTNKSRAYPLADATGGMSNTLPSRLLVDACILVDDSNITSVYVSKLEVSELGWMLSLTAMYDGEPIEVPRVISVSYTSNECVAKFLKSDDDNRILLAGSFSIGDSTAVQNWPPATTFTEAEGAVFEGVLHDVSGLFVTGIQLGDTLLTGTINLVAGDGIEFTSTKDDDTGAWTLAIRNTKYTTPSANMMITTDADLVKALTDAYGTPITSINGVTPDADGKINISTPKTEDPNFHHIIGEATDVSGVLTLTIAKDPCLDFDTIENLSANLEQLNDRSVRLDDGIKALDRSINSVATQMTRLDK